MIERSTNRLRKTILRTVFNRYVFCATVAACLMAGGIGLGSLQAKPKTEKFQGTVVTAGPKAITVKSAYNIYLVRTFTYAPDLEQKMQRGKPQAGKKVTVHYVRGSELATKVD